MHDADICRVTLVMVQRRKDSRAAIVVNELDHRGEVRADRAAFNGHMMGYELFKKF